MTIMNPMMRQLMSAVLITVTMHMDISALQMNHQRLRRPLRFSELKSNLLSSSNILLTGKGISKL